jgi:hypothetical protein
MPVSAAAAAAAANAHDRIIGILLMVLDAGYFPAD